MGVFVLKPNQIEFNRLIELKNDLNLKFKTSQADTRFSQCGLREKLVRYWLWK
jgi:hypothetical protein